MNIIEYMSSETRASDSHSLITGAYLTWSRVHEAVERINLMIENLGPTSLKHNLPIATNYTITTNYTILTITTNYNNYKLYNLNNNYKLYNINNNYKLYNLNNNYKLYNINNYYKLQSQQ